MEFLFEPLFQLLGEFIVNLILRVLVELLFRGLFNLLPRQLRPIVEIAGAAILGGLCGLLSVAMLPHSLIAAPLLRQVNLVATPLAVGAVIMLAGRRQAKFGRTVLQIDHFVYGNIFTFCAVLVRFLMAA